MITRLTAIAVLTCSAGIADAGPVDGRLLHHDASFVLHVDMAGLTASRIGPPLLKPDDPAWAEFTEMTGINLHKDIAGLTLYATRDMGENGVLVVQGNDALEAAIDHIRSTDGSGYEAVEHNGLTLHHLDMEGESTYVFIAPGERRGNRIAVMSNDVTIMERAISVLRGDTPSLESRIGHSDHNGLSLDVSANTLVYVESCGLPWVPDGEDPASAIARQTDRVSVEVREGTETSGIHARISAASSADAGNIVAVLHGLLAIGRLAAGDDPDLAPLIELSNGIQINSNGNDVIINAEFPTDLVVEMLNELNINYPDQGDGDTIEDPDDWDWD